MAGWRGEVVAGWGACGGSGVDALQSLFVLFLVHGSTQADMTLDFYDNSKFSQTSSCAASSQSQVCLTFYLVHICRLILPIQPSIESAARPCLSWPVPPCTVISLCFLFALQRSHHSSADLTHGALGRRADSHFFHISERLWLS